MKIQVGIITVSDRAAAGQYEDFGGPLVAEAADGYGWSVIAETVVPDDKEQIQRAIREQIAKGAHLVLTTGGTGVAPRDMTPEAVKEIMTAHDVKLLIHGHTHRPNVHSLQINQAPAQRIVLGDWDRSAWYIWMDDKSCELKQFPIA